MYPGMRSCYELKLWALPSPGLLTHGHHVQSWTLIRETDISYRSGSIDALLAAFGNPSFAKKTTHAVEG